MIKTERLKQIIDDEKGLKRKFVAEKVGLTQGSFKNMINGNIEISFAKAQEIAKFLKVGVYEIWTDLDKK